MVIICMIGARGKSCYTHDVFYAHYIQAMDMLWAFIIIYCTVSPHIFASELESAIIIIIGLEGVEWGNHVVWHGEKCYTLIGVFLWLIILLHGGWWMDSFENAQSQMVQFFATLHEDCIRAETSHFGASSLRGQNITIRIRHGTTECWESHD